jgi:hypothetical protein
MPLQEKRVLIVANGFVGSLNLPSKKSAKSIWRFIPSSDKAEFMAMKTVYCVVTQKILSQ